MVEKKPDKESPLKAMAITGVLGADLAVPVVIGYYVGNWLDARVGTSPLFLVLAILLGMALGIFAIIKHVTQLISEKPKK